MMTAPQRIVLTSTLWAGLCSSIASTPGAILAQAPAVSVVMDTLIRPGHREFARYDTPSQCFQAVASTVRIAERALWDTAAYAPERDTLPTSAVDIARQCGNQFSAAAVAPAELQSLLNLALVLHKDDEARRAADRWIASASSPMLRGWIMHQVVLSYLHARPRRTAAATAMSERLDSLGDAAVVPRVNTYSVLLEDAKQRFDTAEIRRDATGTLRLDHLLTDDQRQNANLGGGSGNALLELFAVELFRSPATAVDATLRYATDAGYHLPSETDARNFLTALTTPIGRPAPPLPATYWFGARHSNAWPLVGKPSLLIWETERNGEWGYTTYAMIRRLHEKFGDALDITLMTQTHGYFEFTPLPPAQEADSIRTYYQKYLALPVTVAIEETPYEMLPDGRRLDGAPTISRAMIYGFGPVVVDTQGRLVGYGGGTQAIIEAYVRRALEKE